MRENRCRGAAEKAYSFLIYDPDALAQSVSLFVPTAAHAPS
jgi:hypothetical protein